MTAFGPVASHPVAVNGPDSGTMLAGDSLAAAVTMGAPALTQVHALTGGALDVIASLGAPALTQSHALVADAIALPGPDLESPALVHVVVLTADAIAVAGPDLGAPAIGQIHAVLADALALDPALDTPALFQVHVVSADDLPFGPATFGEPTLSGRLLFAYKSGQWHIGDLYARHSGTWKAVTQAWMKRNGVWESIYTEE